MTKNPDPSTEPGPGPATPGPAASGGGTTGPGPADRTAPTVPIASTGSTPQTGQVPPAPSAPPAGQVPPPTGSAPPAGQVPPPGAPREPAPTTSVGWVIAGVILFWPTAIPALLASQKAAQAIGAGDRATAAAESARAKRWGIVSVSVAAGLFVLSVIATFLWFVILAFATYGDHGHIFYDDEYGRTYHHGAPWGVPDGDGSWEFPLPGDGGPSRSIPDELNGDQPSERQGERSGDRATPTVPAPDAGTPQSPSPSESANPSPAESGTTEG